ncbi:AhpC-TSA-domain-containing protein [Coprinellus micaceus]|uniref:thioredoxin-dependent peroxiredoxin n=1 Tax=Coprinellus micaceus TaxID=71717 RepID=A0A4Y7T9D1_COPMI|nr:AhpC-TSA-domain-containing protein [Coprinellus micaceus]
MAPRGKATENAEGGDQAAPRRSTRIAGIPQPAAAAAATKPAPKKAAAGSSKKRAVEDGDAKAESSAKKSKASSPAEVAEDAAGIIEIGGSLPDLTLKNEKGEDIQVADLAAEKGVVFFLVPKADTPGCTQQACGFRDIYPDFSSHNFEVYCLSADQPTAQAKWQTKKELPYPLLSDPKRTFITALGAGDGGKTKRSHFIFAQGGKLVDKKIPVKPMDSPRLALEFIKTLQEGEP